MIMKMSLSRIWVPFLAIIHGVVPKIFCHHLRYRLADEDCNPYDTSWYNLITNFNHKSCLGIAQIGLSENTVL